MNRTSLFKQEASFSLIYKSIDIIISFLLVRLFIEYFDYETYGIWMVIFSIVSYFRFLNLGLDQGLRNILTKLIANKNHLLARKYISTIYIFLFFICIFFYFLFFLINQNLNWQNIFNSNLYSNNEYILLNSIIFFSFFITLFLKIIITILLSHQRASYLNLFTMLEKLFQICVLLILMNYYTSSILYVALLFSVIPILILFFMSFYYFLNDYKHLKPSFKLYDYSCIRPLFDLGIKFFIINISVIILFSTDNLIIAQLLGPESVVSYHIIAKYFNIPILVFSLLAQPLWSSVTDAYAKQDFNWIKKTINKLESISIYFLIIIIIMFFISDYVFAIWLNDNIYFPLLLKIIWALFAFSYIINMIYTYAINGMGKIKLQLYFSILSSIINIPLSILFASHFNMGNSGVILATLISIFLYIPYKYIQYQKLVNNKAFGVWNK